VHGAGANLDNFETHDDRPIIPGTCCSIEPGIYQPDFGVRTEFNVFVEERGARVLANEANAIVAELIHLFSLTAMRFSDR